MRDNDRYYECLGHFVGVIRDIFSKGSSPSTYNDANLWMINTDWADEYGGRQIRRFFRTRFERPTLDDYLASHETTRPERDERLRVAVREGLRTFMERPVAPNDDEPAFDLHIPGSYLNSPV